MKYKEIFSLSFLLVSVCIVTGCNSGGSSEQEVKTDQQYTDKINQLIEDKKISEALSFIEDTDDQTIEDQITLTEIPAPPFKEEERSQKFAQMLEQYGADSVWTDSIGNAIGLRKGTSRDSVLAVAAHLDTVFPIGTDVTVRTVGDTREAMRNATSLPIESLNAPHLLPHVALSDHLNYWRAVRLR